MPKTSTTLLLTKILFVLKKRNTVWININKFAMPKTSTTLPLTKILFVLKKRNTVWNTSDQYAAELSSGLLNSVRFVSKMIRENFGQCLPVLEQVVDGNDINRVVFQHKPNLVIIEALWATPEKLNELSSLYPNVKWIVRLHSEVPFLANEGVAMEWLNGYSLNRKIFVATNSVRAQRELNQLLHRDVLYLPNCYEIENC
jgi:hypothetical protein